MKLRQEKFGNLPEMGEVSLFTITNSNGIILKVSNYGGIIQSIQVPDKSGHMEDVVLGFDKFEDYLSDHPYIGTVVGRYANRISLGKFSIDGKEYSLAQNNGQNHIHGGIKGFDKVLWDVEEFVEKKRAGVYLNYLSKDMEEGYPGNLNVRLSFSLDESNQVSIDYEASSDKSTALNLTQHSYFNLGGGYEPVYDHELQINSDRYVIGDKNLIPSGEIGRTAGGPLDFTKPKLIGKDLDDVDGGYDHCYVLDSNGKDARFAGRVNHPGSGRVMEVYTTEPGMQFYSSNFLEGIAGKNGQSYEKHQALCLETQHYPDSPNHPEFPNTILRPGEIYTQKTIYKFLTG